MAPAVGGSFVSCTVMLNVPDMADGPDPSVTLMRYVVPTYSSRSGVPEMVPFSWVVSHAGTSAAPLNVNENESGIAWGTLLITSLSANACLKSAVYGRRWTGSGMACCSFTVGGESTSCTVIVRTASVLVRPSVAAAVKVMGYVPSCSSDGVHVIRPVDAFNARPSGASAAEYSRDLAPAVVTSSSVAATLRSSC